MLKHSTPEGLLADQLPHAVGGFINRVASDPFCVALSKFLQELQKRQDEHLAKLFAEHANRDEFMATHREFFALSPNAKRYVRVIKRSASGTHGSAYCFIDLHSGDVFKPAGWKGPEKNFPRGNILQPGAIDGTGVYGVTRAR